MSRRHRQQRQGSPDKDDSLWVQSGVAASGAYVVEFHVTDRAWVRTPEEATRHALAVLRQAEIAAHDAAVIRQLVTLGIDLQMAATVVANDLRPDRPEVDPSDTAPLGVAPGVAGEDTRPFLIISLDGERMGQWTVTDARQHALSVLEIITVADLDAAYKRVLMGQIRLEDWRAAAVVDDLATYRHVDPAPTQ